jgi:hypothetical protein
VLLHHLPLLCHLGVPHARILQLDAADPLATRLDDVLAPATADKIMQYQPEVLPCILINPQRAAVKLTATKQNPPRQQAAVLLTLMDAISLGLWHTLREAKSCSWCMLLRTCNHRAALFLTSQPAAAAVAIASTVSLSTFVSIVIVATLAATASAAAAATAAAAVGSTYQPRVPAALMLLP